LTSERKRRANRANAKSSTGPKSAVGKAHAAKNALRHGLNISIYADPALAPEIETIAQEIAGANAHREAFECARRIAEAQVDLNRVRDHRRRMIGGLLLEHHGDFGAISREGVSQLSAIDRYERRALSRRKFAIREFDASARGCPIEKES
jgi:hypothetical protein